MMDRRSHLLRDQRGTTLIEVVVAAAVLLMVSAAVVQLVTGAQTQSGQVRIAAIGADLAQSELEMLRSQKFSSLLSLPAGAQNVTAGGQTFSVQKTASWAMESPPGATDCATSGRNPEALKLSVTVTWPQMKRKPITIDSLIAAPPGSRAHRGNYIVQLTDRDALGVQGVLVQLQGASMSHQTDENGCVRFSNVPEGDYTVSFAEPGYVDRSNVNAITKPVTVVAGQTGSASFDYDRAGSALVNFRRNSTAAAVPGARFVNSNVTLVGTLQNGGTRAVTPSMWPAAEGYAVYADTCTAGPPVAQVTIPQGSQGTTTAQLPGLRLQITELPSSADPSAYRARVVTQCGSTLAEVAGGTLVRANGNRYTLTSNEIVVPPGTMALACLYKVENGRYYWRESNSVTVAAGDNPRTVSLGNDSFETAFTTNPGALCT
jgi:Tfp pilus assembly protein PilV